VGSVPGGDDMAMPTVLLVDDDAQIRGAVRDLLVAEGHRVLTARNGVEAHALAEAHPPSAIVLDLLMPVAGGWDLVSRLRELGLEDVPVILFSGSADLENEARRIGAARWLRKPCPFDRLLGALREVLPRS